MFSTEIFFDFRWSPKVSCLPSPYAKRRLRRASTSRQLRQQHPAVRVLSPPPRSQRGPHRLHQPPPAPLPPVRARLLLLTHPEPREPLTAHRHQYSRSVLPHSAAHPEIPDLPAPEPGGGEPAGAVYRQAADVCEQDAVEDLAVVVGVWPVDGMHHPRAAQGRGGHLQERRHKLLQ